MSISQARNFIEKSGCGLAVGIVIILVLVVGFVSQFGRGGGAQDPQAAEMGLTIAKVGDYAITQKEIQDGFQQVKATSMGSGALSEAFHYAESLNQAVSRALTYDLAKQKGINPSDDEIMATVKAQLKSGLEQRQMLQPNATDEQVAEAFKKASGRDWDEFMDETSAKLDDPQSRAVYAAMTAAPLVEAAIRNGLNPTDEDVRKANGTLVVKSITLKSGADAQKKAESILKEIRGGLSFETAMDRYSTSQPPKRKLKSQVTEDLPAFSVMTIDAFKSMRGLKPGTISDVVPNPFEGPKIYKIVSFKEKPKADFEKEQQMLKEQYVNTLGNIEYGKQIEAAAGKVKWESEGFKLLFDWNKAQRLSDAERKAKDKEFYDKAKEIVETTDDVGQEVAGLVHYATVESMWREGSPAEKAKLRDERITLLKEAFDRTAEIQLAVDLTDMLIEKKDKEAGTFLLEMARSNQEFEVSNESYFTQVSTKLAKLKKLGLVTAEEEKEILAEQKRWKEEVGIFLLDAAKENQDFESENQSYFTQISVKLKSLKKIGALDPKAEKDILAEQDRWKKGAGADLLETAKENKAFDAENQENFTQISVKLDALKKIGALSSTTEQAIRAEQERWRKGKKAHDSQAAKKAADEKKKADAKTTPPKTDQKPETKKPATTGN